ncbi:MAG: hypothetical protein LC745_11705, partial [Planctomycetia bacterium]|nr:hypothetical protein [Planctomycetia bacterium]
MLNHLYQYIVPLAFIAIWALTSLFNRESQPLPPRTARPPVPNGLRTPPTAAPGRAADWRVAANSRETLSTRPTGSGSIGPPARLGSRQDDDILIIEAEPRRPAAGRGGAAPTRRTTKARPSG